MSKDKAWRLVNFPRVLGIVPLVITGVSNETGPKTRDLSECTVIIDGG